MHDPRRTQNSDGRDRHRGGDMRGQRGRGWARRARLTSRVGAGRMTTGVAEGGGGKDAGNAAASVAAVARRSGELRDKAKSAPRLRSAATPSAPAATVGHGRRETRAA